MLRTIRSIAGLLVLLISISAYAEGEFIDIYPKSQEEIQLILDTVNQQLQSPATEQAPPIIMMLHGKEAARFLKSAYADNMSLIDQTAKLSAFGLLDVKICETWLKKNRHEHTELFPFIGTVPYGAGELERLSEEEGYTEFAIDL